MLSRGGKRRRRIGFALIVCGLVAAVYAATVVLWRDPATDVYYHFQQQRLESALADEFDAWRPATGQAEAGWEPQAHRRDSQAANTGREAQRFERRLETGQALGRLRIPRIGLDAVVVNGTRWAQDLSRGPGHYEETEVPGLGKTVGIAGHRTTFGAPFRHIDDLRAGDLITLEMPYATFRYRVFAHEIVSADDWSVIRDRGFEAIMLSACHPLYSSEQRWIVYGREVQIQPPARSFES